MIGRIVAGLSIGGLSVMVPAYQGESAPRHIRGAIVCCYQVSSEECAVSRATDYGLTLKPQLFITIGILIANLINFGTESIENTASWRVPMGIGFLFAIVLGFGILFFPETPRHEYRNGKIDGATTSIAKFNGVSEKHKVVRDQLVEMQEKLQMEIEGGEHPLYEIFTGPRMMYRVIVGMVIQALQQLTGANYYFYYGTTVFSSVGLSNSYVTQIILGRRKPVSIAFIIRLTCLRRRERCDHLPRPILCGEVWTTQVSDDWRRVDVHVLHDFRLSRTVFPQE